jgi:hypothetical protein
MGPGESAIRHSIRAGESLETTAQKKPFTVDTIDQSGVALLFGRKQTRTPFTWEALEGIRTQFLHSGWIVIGGRRDVHGEPGTLDGYVKQVVNRDAAGCVASLLEEAGVVELDRARPGRMRVTAR